MSDRWYTVVPTPETGKVFFLKIWIDGRKTFHWLKEEATVSETKEQAEELGKFWGAGAVAVDDAGLDALLVGYEIRE